MPIGKHLRISTEYRMGLAVTVSQQLLITAQTHTQAFLSELKRVKVEGNKHF